MMVTICRIFRTNVQQVLRLSSNSSVTLLIFGPVTIQRNSCEWSSAIQMNPPSPFTILLLCPCAWSMGIAEKLGYFRKYPHPPTDDNELVPKNFRISKKDSSSLCSIPNPADSNSGEFQNFERFCDKNSQNIRKIRGIPVRLTEHLLQDFQCRPFGVCGYFLE